MSLGGTVRSGLQRESGGVHLITATLYISVELKTDPQHFSLERQFQRAHWVYVHVKRV